MATWQSAQEAMKAKDYAKAKDELTVAIDSGGLSPDQYSEACMQRAVCFAQLKEFESAHEDLDTLAQGATNMARVYAARAAVFTLEGNRAAAVSAFTKARRLNPRIQAFVQ